MPICVRLLVLVLLIGASGAQAQQPTQSQSAPAPATTPAPPPQSTVVPATAVPPAGAAVAANYVIGADDVLGVFFWRDKELSGDVIVRPDGKISLPLLNDVQAAGLTPEQLRQRLEEDAKRYIEDPSATVVVRQINSRKVFIIGEVQRPGPYPLTAPTTVLQLIGTAGGLLEYADAEHIKIVRPDDGRSRNFFRFNYREVVKGKRLQQNIELKPGDTIIVP